MGDINVSDSETEFVTESAAETETESGQSTEDNSTIIGEQDVDLGDSTEININVSATPETESAPNTEILDAINSLRTELTERITAIETRVNDIVSHNSDSGETDPILEEMNSQDSESDSGEIKEDNPPQKRGFIYRR